MIDPDRALDFLHFVEERHQVWNRRQQGKFAPWTDDPIINSKKFTNVFRMLDPGSQFVIQDLLSDKPEPADFLMRCFLYRHTNLPEAWRTVRAELGEYPTRANLDTVQEVFHEIKQVGGRVFSGAYMIYPQSAVPGTDKIDSIVDLTRRLFVSSNRVLFDFLGTSSQAERFNALRTNKGVADFMSMQILTDFGYSTRFRENDFVVPGPGARKGAAALDPTSNPRDVLEWAFNAVHAMEEVPSVDTRDELNNIDVYLRPSRMDVQNCLCEFSKYVRYQASPSNLKPYAPAHPGVQFPPVLPEHW